MLERMKPVSVNENVENICRHGAIFSQIYVTKINP